MGNSVCTSPITMPPLSVLPVTQLVGDRLGHDRQRVVARGGERARQPRQDAGAVVEDL